MPTANYVTIDGVAYSPKHPKAKRLELPKSIVNVMNKDIASQIPARAFVSTDEKKLNKTEKRFLGQLRLRWMNKAAVRVQAIRLELAERCTFLPDFSVWYDSSLTFYECKGGFIRDDAIVKLKTAARLYPEFDFWLCQYKKGEWKETLMPK